MPVLPDLFPSGLWQLLDQLSDAIFCGSHSGKVLGWNRAAQPFLHKSPILGESDISDVLRGVSPNLEMILGSERGTYPCTVRTPERVVPAQVSIYSSLELAYLPHRFYIFTSRSPLESEGDIASMMSFYSRLVHEIKNPLASIKVMVQAAELELSSLNPSADIFDLLGGYSTRINQEVNRIVRLLDAVKFLSRLERPKIMRFDLVDVARSVISLYSAHLEERRLRYQLVVPDLPIELEGIPDEYRQMLANLIDFTLAGLIGRGGSLKLELTSSEKGYQITIEGAGVRPDPQTDSHSAIVRFGQDSLNELVAKWIVERQGGTVYYPSAGAYPRVVRVWLPRNTVGP